MPSSAPKAEQAARSEGRQETPRERLKRLLEKANYLLRLGADPRTDHHEAASALHRLASLAYREDFVLVPSDEAASRIEAEMKGREPPAKAKAGAKASAPETRPSAAKTKPTVKPGDREEKKANDGVYFCKGCGRIVEFNADIVRIKRTYYHKACEP